MFHLWGEQTGAGESGVAEIMEGAHLCSPCAVTCHPLTVKSVLSIKIVIDSLRGESPFSFEDRVLQEGLDTFKWITVKQCNRLHGTVPVHQDILHFPFRALRKLIHTTAQRFRRGEGE